MGWINLTSKSFYNSPFTINAIVGCILHNFCSIGLTPSLIPKLCTTKLGSNPSISAYDHKNTLDFSLRMETNSYLLFLVNDFPNWII